MKILKILSIVLFSSVVLAEKSPVDLVNSTKNVTTSTSVIPKMVLTNYEANSLALWKYLDNNKDGSISKMEAAISGEVFDNWDNLDTNNDKKIDTEEFVHLFYKGN